jgi:hypothetical protein
MPEELAVMIVFVVLIVTTGAVAIFRPIAKQLADFLSASTQQKRTPTQAPQLIDVQTREAIANLEARLALLEERQNFTDSLLSGRRDAQLHLPQG